MEGKRLVWAVIGGMTIWSGYRLVRHGEDPSRRIIGIGGAGIMLLLLSEVNDELASAFAILTGVAVAIGNAGTIDEGNTTG